MVIGPDNKNDGDNMRNMKTRHKITALTVGTLTSVALAVSTTGFGAPPAMGAVCSAAALDATTLTLPAVAAAVGAPIAWASGITGSGIDVALIDTGITAVPGLASAGKISDAVDLSFDAPQANLRYRDLHGHGTNMAGIIAGDGTGGLLTRGVAPGARLVNVKVGAGDGSVDASQVIAALAAARTLSVPNLK